MNIENMKRGFEEIIKGLFVRGGMIKQHLGTYYEIQFYVSERIVIFLREIVEIPFVSHVYFIYECARICIRMEK